MGGHLLPLPGQRPRRDIGLMPSQQAGHGVVQRTHGHADASPAHVILSKLMQGGGHGLGIMCGLDRLAVSLMQSSHGGRFRCQLTRDGLPASGLRDQGGEVADLGSNGCGHGLLYSIVLDYDNP